MFAKLVALILALGACGGGLLAMRQSRLQAAHELAAARLRLREHDERLLRLKAAIAARTTPPEIGQKLARLEGSSLVPAIDHPAELPMPFETMILDTEWTPEVPGGANGAAGDRP